MQTTSNNCEETCMMGERRGMIPSLVSRKVAPGVLVDHVWTIGGQRGVGGISYSVFQCSFSVPYITSPLETDQCLIFWV